MEMKTYMTIWDYIDDLVGDSKFVTRGSSLFRQGKIILKKDEYLEATVRHIESIAKEEERYEQNIFLSDKKLLPETTCNCPTFEAHGTCKHIAATLFAANENDSIFNIKDVELNDIIDVEEELEPENLDENTVFSLKLELTKVENHNYHIAFILTDNDEVTVRNLNIKNFYLNYVRMGNAKVTTTKGLLDIANIRVTREAKAVLKYLNKAVNSHLTKANNKQIPEQTLRAFLQDTITMPLEYPILYRASQEEDFIEYHVKNGVPNFHFQVGLENAQLLNIQLEEGEDHFEPSVFFSRKKAEFIIYPSVVQQFLSFFVKNPENDKILMLFPVHNAATLLVKQTTMLGMPITIAPEVWKLIKKEELFAKLYMTRSIQGMELQLEFHYGDVFINPINNKESVPGFIVFRDNEKEQQILQKLKEVDAIDFTDEGIFMYDFEAVFDFLEYQLSEIVELGVRAFVDDSLKKIRRNPLKMQISTVLMDGGLMDVQVDLDGMELAEIESAMQQYKLKKRYIELKDGSFLDVQNSGMEEQFQELEKIAEALPQVAFDEHMQLPSYRIFELAQNTEAVGKYIEIDGALEKMMNELRYPQAEPLALAESVKPILRKYQLIGVYWLQKLAEYQLGGILADDMGLGKTLQVISYITTLERTEPILIIAPKTLIYNWKKEFEKFAPNIDVVLIDGNASQREKQIAKSGPTDIIITSYPLIAKDQVHYEQAFSHIFIDEAQYIKNPNTKISKSIKLLTSKYKFALTGTPVENNLLELWSIFDFVMPGFLGSAKAFIKNTLTPIQKHNDKEKLTALQNKIELLILRRLKKTVLSELPDKIETPLYCEMGEKQEQVYQYYLSKAQNDVRKEIHEKGFNKSRIKILTIITRLRQVCAHPSMFLDDYNGGSAKVDMLEEVLEEAIDGGHKILLFSQFTSMLEIIKGILERKKIKHLYLHGGTKAKDRMDMVDEFSESDTSVFLLSLKAGGTGLNLTAADIVIHFDPWWNPSVENQATDRAYRFGQENKVQVFQFITKNTIEEKIQLLKQRKQELFNALFNNEENAFEMFSEEDIKTLLDVE